MPEGLTTDLLVAAMVVGMGGLVICLRVLSWQSSIALVSLKIAIPVVYFAVFFDGTWTFFDDVTYFNQGRELLARGYNPFLFFFDRKAVAALAMMSGGHHILYGWYNLFSQYLFGPHYFSAVFLNVGLTFLAAYVLFRLAIVAGFSVRYSTGLFLFFSIHWELLAWSSLVNLKDILILLMTSFFLYGAILALRTGAKRYIAMLCAMVFLFYWIRFYVPFLLLLSVALYLLAHGKSKKTLWVILITVTLATGYGAYLGFANVAGDLGRLDPREILWGASRMALTPQPWSTEPSYAFLILPSVLHWMFFVPAVVGGWLLWRENRYARLILIYVLVALLFYGSFALLQGPRHRIQLLFATAWMEFHFIWCLLRVSLKRRVPEFT